MRSHHGRSLLVALLTLACSHGVTDRAAVPPGPAVPDPGAFREVDVRYPSGEIELAAALLLPESPGPHPGAVILQGSGSSDRTNSWARGFAEAMARRGIVVLLTDKRGSGASEGDWREVGFDELARDALAGVAFLGDRPEVRPDAVGLVGLSQGGHVAPLAADLSPEVAFVVTVSSSATTMNEQIDHEMRNTFRQAGLGDERVEEGMALQALAVDYVRTGRWEPYERALEAALSGPLAPVAEGFPQSRDSWVWEWARKVGDYDPIPHWKALDQPVLVLYGEEDEHDNVPVGESVRRLREALSERAAPWDVVTFPGSGHALYPPDATEPIVRRDALDLLVRKVYAFTSPASG